MPAGQLLLHLPEDLLARFRASVPNRERSAFVQRLLEQALPEPEEEEDDDNDPLYLAALAAEQDAQLRAEAEEWEAGTISDWLSHPDLNDPAT